MKLHIGVDCEAGLAHVAAAIAANVHGKHPLARLLRGHEERFCGDCADTAQQELIRSNAP